MKTSNARRFGVIAAAVIGLLGAIANAGHHGEMKVTDSVDPASASVIETNVGARNGVNHPVDSVILLSQEGAL